MEPITLLREPDGGLEGEEAASWAEDAGSFYRTMAEELLSLGRLSADIQWAPDVPLRAKRPAVVAKTPAPTGRAPAPVSVVVPVARREQVRREPVARRELPVAREVAEVTTKKPPHLASHATRPVPTGVRVGRGRTAPHQSAAQSRAGRRLRLGAKAPHALRHVRAAASFAEERKPKLEAVSSPVKGRNDEAQQEPVVSGAVEASPRAEAVEVHDQRDWQTQRPQVHDQRDWQTQRPQVQDYHPDHVQQKQRPQVHSPDHSRLPPQVQDSPPDHVPHLPPQRPQVHDGRPGPPGPQVQDYPPDHLPPQRPQVQERPRPQGPPGPQVQDYPPDHVQHLPPQRPQVPDGPRPPGPQVQFSPPDQVPHLPPQRHQVHERPRPGPPGPQVQFSPPDHVQHLPVERPQVHDGRPGPPGPQVWDGRPEVQEPPRPQVQEPPRPQVWDVRPEVQEPPRPQVRLLEVLDLQLFQPRQSQVAREELQPHDEEIFEKEDDPRQPVVEAAKRRGVTSSPSSPRSPNGRTPAAEVQAPVRPLRGLILEVIDEMSKPPMYQEPAEVLGGSELAPLFAAPKARPKAAPVDEDTYGRRLGRAPPPYQVGPPPPYDGPNRAVVEAEEKLRKKLREKQEDLKSQEKALQVSQAEAQAQVKQLIELQKKADEQSAAVAQAQASLQAQIQSQREESQRFLDSVQQSFARSRAEEAEGRGVEGHAGVRAVPGSSDVHERLGRLEALLEGRFTETLRAMAAQSEERKAYVAALADQKSAPMQMVPLCVPQPAPPAPPPQPKVTVASQTQVEDPTKKKEHQARMARFTHYLLHGPPGAPAAEPAWKALALRERLEQREDKSSVAASSSATASQAMERMPYAVRAEAASSPGEVLPRASQQRHARAPRGRSGSSLGEVTMSGRSSPGELRSNGEVTDRGDVSGSEEGELPFPLSRAVPPSTGEVSRGEQAADSLSARSSGEVSSFAA